MKIGFEQRETRLGLIQWIVCAVPQSHTWLKLVAFFALFVVLPGLAQTSAPGQLADQYVRTDFSVENGLPDNVVDAIVQTGNGVLWVGTQSGLARFDGREFTAIDLSAGEPTPQGAVHSLLESSRGDLWVGTDAGVVLIPKAALDRFDPSLLTFHHLGGGSNQVVALAETRRGDVWAGSNHGLYHFDGRNFVQVIANDGVSRISEALNGNLLVIGGKEFVEWNGQQVIRHPGLAASLGIHDEDIYQAFQDRNGTMWYGTRTGLFRRGETAQPALQPTNVANSGVFRILQDRDGAIWFSSRLGLYRVHGDQLESPAPGLNPRSFCFDRDGDLWIGTNGNGLVHLRRRVVRMFTTADGLPVDIAMAILQAHDGKLWVGGNCGFSEFDGTHFKIYNEKDGLLNTCVWSLAEDLNYDLWIGTYGGGIFRMHEGHFTQFSTQQGLAGQVVQQISVAHDGSLWIATQDGLSHMQNGHFRNYTIAEGLSSNQILSIHQDRSGTLWVATQAGVNRLEGDRLVPFPPNPSGARPFAIRFAEDSQADLFTLESPRGISLVSQDRLVSANQDFMALGMVESPEHDLWFSGKSGITRVRRDDLINSAWSQQGPLDYQTFDRSHGLASIQCSVGRPNIALTPDGKLWVATVKGLAMIDLTRIPHETKPPKLFVGSITVGRDKAQAGEELTLPPGTHHLEMHLEAVDLSSPEQVRLQYRMDGVDSFWIDADRSRTAVYSNLPQGRHAFHVRASASNGAWDRTGIVFDVTQQPYFFQTIWFRLIAAAAFILLISTVYLLRVRQILGLAQMRMEERVAERERIARDLHDTLMQGVFGASMQLDLAEDQIPDESPAKPLVKHVIQTMSQVAEEGRVALRALRMQDLASGDLAISLLRIRQEVAADERISFRVIANTVTRPLRPQIRDEVYRIGREAVMNAFIHAKANSIEVEIEYAATYLRVVVRDDGGGVDPEVLQSGREGHWGLSGMQERAEQIGAILKLRSRIGAGTEVELKVPAAIAFEDGVSSRFPKWLSWLSRDAFETKTRHNGKE